MNLGRYPERYTGWHQIGFVLLEGRAGAVLPYA